MEPKDPDWTVPTVGTWEFEPEDEEYTLFLELFLSYMLEKDRLDAEESELPLLSAFSQQLRTRELHSVTFDMLTALKRRQNQKRSVQLPVFHAGHCFQTLPVTPPSSIGPVQSDTHTAGKHGLFALRRHATLTSKDAKVNSISTDVGSTSFKIVSQAEVDVQMELDSSLEARFPRLARLLEWMMRWADRRVLLSQPIRKTSEGSGDSVVIRVKASTPAVLTALELLERRYSAALLGENSNHSQTEVRLHFEMYALN